MIVAGVDLSLVSTGVSLIRLDGLATTSRVRTVGHRGDTYLQRRTRAAKIREAVVAVVRPAELVVIEGPSFASTGGQAHDRAGLWWLAYDAITDLGIPIGVMPPSTRAMYGTGRGNANKDEVLAAAIKRYPHIAITGNDIADAVLLAAAGMRHLGHPIEQSLPATHLRAIDKTAWPTQGELIPA